MPAEYLIISPRLECEFHYEFVHKAYVCFAQEAAVHFTNNELGFMAVWTQDEEIYYAHLFIKSSSQEPYNFIKPAGHYLQLVCKGGDDEVAAAYQSIQDYLLNKQLVADDRFYEVTLNQTTADNEQAYLTLIQVRVNN